MRSRLAFLRECAEYLGAGHGGDRQATCLENGVRVVLELAADILTACAAPPAHGYKDACDKLVACGAVPVELGDRLKLICDVADRLPLAWSTLAPGELDSARRQAATALPAFADLCEHLLGGEARA